MRPLHVLVFLSPLVAAYEVGSVRYLTRPGVIETIEARSIIGRFFDAFGASSFHLPGIAVVAVLLAWHLLIRDKWTVRPAVLVGMLLESAVWTLPLLVLSMIIASGAPAMQEGAVPLAAHTREAKITLALGAGIYEELLFRLILITFLHFVLVDVAKVEHKGGCVVAVLVAAVAFAFYHNLAAPGNPGFANVRLLVFYTLAGAYFGAVFLLRGVGIVVGTHALYDVVVLLLKAQ